MKGFRIIYNEGNTYNIKTMITAEDRTEAVVKFNMEHPLANEITEIEEVE